MKLHIYDKLAKITGFFVYQGPTSSKCFLCWLTDLKGEIDIAAVALWLAISLGTSCGLSSKLHVG